MEVRIAYLDSSSTSQQSGYKLNASSVEFGKEKLNEKMSYMWFAGGPLHVLRTNAYR